MKHNRSHPPNLSVLHIHDPDTVLPLRISRAGDEYRNAQTHTHTYTHSSSNMRSPCACYSFYYKGCVDASFTYKHGCPLSHSSQLVALTQAGVKCNKVASVAQNSSMFNMKSYWQGLEKTDTKPLEVKSYLTASFYPSTQFWNLSFPRQWRTCCPLNPDSIHRLFSPAPLSPSCTRFLSFASFSCSLSLSFGLSRWKAVAGGGCGLDGRPALRPSSC